MGPVLPLHPLVVHQTYIRFIDQGGRLEAVVVRGDPGADLVALDDALNALARVDPRKVRVVEMRFFAGLSVEETATVLKVSPVTVRRDWSSAKIWLYRALTGETDDGLELLETAR